MNLIFTNKADKAFVERKYRTTYDAVVAPHKVFALENVARALPTDWRNFLWEVVAKGKCLVEVNLSKNEAIEGAPLEPFAAAAAGPPETREVYAADAVRAVVARNAKKRYELRVVLDSALRSGAGGRAASATLLRGDL